MASSIHPPVGILLVEDSIDDAELVGLALRRSGLAARIERVETEPAYVMALETLGPDIVLCDYHLPRFSCQRALDILRGSGAPVPLVVVSRHITHEEAGDCLARGARAIASKGRLEELAPLILAILDRR